MQSYRTNQALVADDWGGRRKTSATPVFVRSCERVCWRARKRGINARTVTLKLRYSAFHTLTRSPTVAPINSERELYPALKEMLATARIRPVAVRLFGVDRYWWP